MRSGIKLLAMDLPGRDDARAKLTLGEILPVYYCVLTHDVTLVECLTDLDRIVSRRVTVVLLPLNIEAADGARAQVTET